MDHHTDSLISQFKQITNHDIVCIKNYDYRDNIDGHPWVRIEYLNDPQPRVYKKMEAILIHHIRQNLDRSLQKQAKFKIEAE